MEGLNRESRQSIYYSVSFITASEWLSNTMKRLDFQRLMAENQLDFPQTSAGVRNFTFIRTEQSPLQVKTASLGPRVSSISISSERPVHNLDLFVKEAEVVCNAYHQTCLSIPCQILQCGVNIRHLYSCEDHAFKYLWESRLGQKGEDFHYLGRPVLGGGLRLFMPPLKEDTEPVQIEIKIESFLQESQKMFIETVFVWPQPRLLSKDDKFDPAFRLTKVEKYATSKVLEFILKPEPK
ncbi:MAG TPA: hypothetical protein ENH43_01095 [Phycisphaerales bacterium]|nr:hypothetical protein [Phycisphaerales bacterium]